MACSIRFSARRRAPATGLNDTNVATIAATPLARNRAPNRAAGSAALSSMLGVEDEPNPPPDDEPKPPPEPEENPVLPELDGVSSRVTNAAEPSSSHVARAMTVSVVDARGSPQRRRARPWPARWARPTDAAAKPTVPMTMRNGEPRNTRASTT